VSPTTLPAGLEHGHDAVLRLVVVRAAAQLVADGEEAAQATLALHALGQFPAHADLVADVLVDVAFGIDHRVGDVGVHLVQELEIAHVADLLGDGGAGAHVEEHEDAQFLAGLVVAAHEVAGGAAFPSCGEGMGASVN